MKAVYRNTKEVVGAIVEVSSSMKLRSNTRPVSVKLTREDRALLDHIEQLQQDSYGAVNSFSPPLKLKVEITSDTFRGGLVGKLINLKEVHQVWVKAHKKWIKGGI